MKKPSQMSLTRRWLSLVTLICGVLLLVGIVGLVIDPRQILGFPAWTKTVKFAVSVGLYAWTLNWMLGVLPSTAKGLRVLGGAGALILLLELPLVVVQTVRGVPSHFNVSTPFDGVVFGLMGTMIMVFSVLFLVMTLWMLVLRVPDRVMGHAMRLGLLIALLGVNEGWLMTAPTPAQQAALDAGQQVVAIGAHSPTVLQDGGAGLPLIGWSTEHGDLRIGHFLGMHGLQFMLLLGWFCSRLYRWSQRQKLRLLTLAGVWYTGMVGVTVWQALRDQPIIQPDLLTVLVASGWTLLGVLLAWGLSRNRLA